jgi:arylsulfatase A-like enzyme
MRFRVSCLLAIGALALTACNESTSNSTASKPRPLDSVLLITVDTLRADHVSCYADSPVRTAAIDAIAAQGARIDRAWSTVPLTTPAHASILTGRYPLGHGVRNNARFRLPEGALTLAEALRGRGLNTAAFVSSITTSQRFGLGQGFELFEDDLGNQSEAGGLRSQRPGEETVALALDWLRARADRPFFLWVHLFDPHTPYSPPKEYANLVPGDLYSGEVAFSDALVGRLTTELQRIGAESRTVVAVMADHGEGLGTHGEKEHGVLLYEETLHVPFVIRAPGKIAPGTVIPGPASVVDFVPTTLALLGLPDWEGLQGVDLFAQDKARAGRRIYAETLYPFEEFGWSALYATRSDDIKYIESPKPELYDLAADPKEGKNLHGADPQRTGAMSSALRQLAQELISTEQLAAAAGFEAASDPETIARLESLGYVAGGGAASSPTDALPSVGGRNPYDAIGDLDLFDRATEAMTSGDLNFAIKLFERLVKSDPHNPQVLMKHALALEQAQRINEADRAYKLLMQRHPTFLVGAMRYSSFLEANGRALDSLNLWLRLGGLMPGYVGVETRAARAELAAGRVDAALTRMTSYTDTRPDDADGWVQLGLAQKAKGLNEAAIGSLGRALSIRATDKEAVTASMELLAGTPRAKQLIESLLLRAPRDPLLLKLKQQLGAP